TPLLTLKHGAHISSAGYSPDGRRIVTGARDPNEVRVWNAATGAPLTPLLHHPREIDAVVFSPDGRWLATGDRAGEALIWEADKGRLLLRLPHPNCVNDVEFSPDGRRIVTACRDHMARIWDA